MKNFRHTMAAASVLFMVSGLAPALSLADDAAPAVIQLPAIACAGPLAKIKADYKEYYQSRIEVAKHFVGDQVDALKTLRDRIKGQMPAIRALMTAAADGTTASKQRAMNSVAQFAQVALQEARGDFSDSSYTTSSWSGGGRERWEERMDTQIMLSNGDYAVAACSHSTSLYNDDLKPNPADLRMCTVLDLNNGMIWGDTPREALELAGNKLDEGDYTTAALSGDYPMCVKAAGYDPLALSKRNEDLAAKSGVSNDVLIEKPLYQSYSDTAQSVF